MLIKKISGNWHKVLVWQEFIVGHKSGGIVVLTKETIKEVLYIPCYDFVDWKIEGDKLYIKKRDGQNLLIRIKSKENRAIDFSITPVDSFPDTIERINLGNILPRLPEKPRAYAFNKDRSLLAIAYKQNGLDFYRKNMDKWHNEGHFSFPNYSFIDGITIDGSTLYIADVFGLRILDISDIANPKLNDEYTLRSWAKDVFVSHDLVFVADVLGVKILDKNKNLVIIGKIETNKNRVAKVIVHGEYAFLSCEALGLKIADVSDASNPRLVGGVILPHGAWDCSVQGNYAYVAAYTGGLLKFNIINKQNILMVAKYESDDEYIGVYANDSNVFAACSWNGIKIFNSDLQLITSYRPSSMLDRCWTVIEKDGLLYIASGKDGVFIVDVSGPAQPKLIVHIQTTEARDLVVDGRHIYVADGRNGVVVYDISDFKAPRCIKTLPSSAFTRGLMVDDQYIYKSDGDGGLEIYTK